jgi:hypothetical protein
MSGGDSSNSSGQGQNGSGQGQMGSGQGQMGSGQGQMGSGQGQMGSGQGETGTVIWQIPVTPYQSSYQNLGSVNLWIDTSQGRMQYAVVQQYSSISLIASTPLGGQGVVYELYPITTGQGAYTTNIYSLNPGDNQLGFVANIVGRHILLFSINNQISNSVVLDVQASINSLATQSNGGLLGQGLPGQ